MEKELERLLYRPKEAFTAAGVSRSKGYALIASGEWTSIKIGRTIRIPVASLHKWIEQQIEYSREEFKGSMLLNSDR